MQTRVDVRSAALYLPSAAALRRSTRTQEPLTPAQQHEDMLGQVHAAAGSGGILLCYNQPSDSRAMRINLALGAGHQLAKGSESMESILPGQNRREQRHGHSPNKDFSCIARSLDKSLPWIPWLRDIEDGLLV